MENFQHSNHQSYTTPSTPRRPPSQRKSAKVARRRIFDEVYNDDTSYFQKLKKQMNERSRVQDWLESEEVLRPSTDCNQICMKEWGRPSTCDHGAKASSWCDKTCLYKFRRYKFCRHVVTACNFCGMPSTKENWMCDCFKLDSDDDDVDYEPQPDDDGATNAG